MNKAAIPIVRSGIQTVDLFAQAVKQNLEQIAGQKQNSQQLVALPSTATLAQVITQMNAILERLQ
jgi:hypothetical protein